MRLMIMRLSCDLVGESSWAVCKVFIFAILIFLLTCALSIWHLLYYNEECGSEKLRQVSESIGRQLFRSMETLLSHDTLKIVNSFFSKLGWPQSGDKCLKDCAIYTFDQVAYSCVWILRSAAASWYNANYYFLYFKGKSMNEICSEIDNNTERDADYWKVHIDQCKKLYQK